MDPTGFELVCVSGLFESWKGYPVLSLILALLVRVGLSALLALEEEELTNALVGVDLGR
jgi:hypothetical protein